MTADPPLRSHSLHAKQVPQRFISVVPWGPGCRPALLLSSIGEKGRRPATKCKPRGCMPRESTGLRDLQAYEGAIGKSRDEFNEKKRAILEHIAQLQQQKNYKSWRDFKLPITRIEKRIGERKASRKRFKRNGNATKSRGRN
jgi:hypothetical protein